MTQPITYKPHIFTNGYAVRKGFSVFFQIYSFLWICFLSTCLAALFWKMSTLAVSGGDATFGNIPQALAYFLPFNLGWDGGFTLEFNAMTYLNIVFLALELIYIVMEIILVCQFKSPAKVSEKSIQIIQSSLAQKPHKVIAKKVQ